MALGCSQHGRHRRRRQRAHISLGPHVAPVLCKDSVSASSRVTQPFGSGSWNLDSLHHPRGGRPIETGGCRRLKRGRRSQLLTRSSRRLHVGRMPYGPGRGWSRGGGGSGDNGWLHRISICHLSRSHKVLVGSLSSSPPAVQCPVSRVETEVHTADCRGKATGTWRYLPSSAHMDVSPWESLPATAEEGRKGRNFPKSGVVTIKLRKRDGTQWVGQIPACLQRRLDWPAPAEMTLVDLK
jgi:hypothetical protein